ncbi:Sporulation initiation inhibitor protein Soj [Paenibacillus konkukensis]|uniref:Sporulation initiation inhibitor protein Soj n=1 Tax=Paenibacillus konkukensis TaxID=2020716 RepID=A0ABY4RUI8_9BACL|nr:ParA family protein [Paenibacillus konkukensis]UQZ85399.1 Sporulation initiation inhibitor protein Soj [Paenibacillus konkukensis]
MAHKISLINMKGGVGKSTLAVNLAWHFSAYTSWLKKVLVIDLDPQFNASQYLLGPDKYLKHVVTKEKPTVYHVFERYSPEFKGIDLDKAIKNITENQSGGKIDLLPAQLELAYTLKNPSDKARNLKEFIDTVESEYDVIIIDCSPTDSMLTEAAYLCTDHVLIPVRPEYLSSIGLPLLYRSILDFKEKYKKHPIEIAGVVFNATDDYSPEENKSKKNVKEVCKNLDIKIFKKEISFSRSYPKGARENAPIFRTSYARYDRSQEFLNFTEEFAKEVGIS